MQTKPIIPEQLAQLSADPSNESLDEDLYLAMQVLLNEYEDFRDSAKNGTIGKTAQFWLIYMDLMRYQIMAHTAVQENDVDLLMLCWKRFLPMYFSLNKLHYAR